MTIILKLLVCFITKIFSDAVERVVKSRVIHFIAIVLSIAILKSVVGVDFGILELVLYYLVASTVVEFVRESSTSGKEV